MAAAKRCRERRSALLWHKRVWKSLSAVWNLAAPLRPVTLDSLIPEANRRLFSLFSNKFCFPRCWTGHPKLQEVILLAAACCSRAHVLQMCVLDAKCIYISSPPPDFMSWWEFRWSTLKQMWCLMGEKKNQFHRRCKDAITLHTEYKPVSCLTIWFQLNYLYMPYFQGWGGRFEARLLKRCSLRSLGLVVNYATFLFCSGSGWVSAGTFQSEQGGEGKRRGMARHPEPR